VRIPSWIKIPAPVAAAVLLAGLTLPAAAAPAAGAARHACCPPGGGPAFPTFVHLPADQARHPGATFEWWYTVGHVSAHGHRFGYEVTLTDSAGTPSTNIAITDQTTGHYYQHVVVYQPAQVSMSTQRLDVRMPSATLAGPMDSMSLTATLPGGAITLRLRDAGPALYPGGTGLIPFLAGQSFYYSLPSLATTGTLTVAGHRYQVSGQSWLDRQWGTWDWTKLHRWTWMAIQLSGGEQLNLWDMYSVGGENRYATVLYPDGHQTIVPVTPLARDASGVWTSPATGQRYRTHWIVHIPGLGTRLDVSAFPRQQEVMASFPGVTPSLFEGAATVTGVAGGRPITGQAYVEQLGHWK
jgi:predicted secreted hydrolase